MTGQFTREEIQDLRDLLELEKIRKSVLLYSHFMDSRNWDAMAQLYAEDAVCEWGPYGHFEGRERIHRQLVDAHLDRIPYDGFHCTTNVWAELSGPDTARSRCYLIDVWPSDVIGPISHPGYPENPILLYAIYENEHRRIDGEWKITRSEIHFSWPKRVVGDDFPRPMPSQA